MDDRKAYALGFAERLKALRLERGMSQRQVCRLARVSGGAYGHYEHGTALPDVHVAAKLAWALAVDADELVGSLEMEEVD